MCPVLGFVGFQMAATQALGDIGLALIFTFFLILEHIIL